MPALIKFFLVFLIGLVGGFLDSTVGSGGLLIIPSLIFLGLPPATAVAVDRLGTVGQEIAAIYKFSKAKKTLWQYVPIFTLFALVGAYFGANILLDLDPQNLQKIIGIILLILSPLIFFKSKLGTQRIKVNKAKKALGFIAYFFLMIYYGFFGTGAGPFSTFVYLYLFGFTIIESHATGIIPWLFLSVTSLFIFIKNGVIDYQIGLVLFISMFIGGYLGAHTALKIGNLWLKRLFLLVVVISAIKLLFF